MIKGLEDTLGMQLFERLPRGIRLTVQGHKIYEYASKIINEVNVLENMASSGMTKWIRISLNPSSWFANQFVDFYNETYEKSTIPGNNSRRTKRNGKSQGLYG